MRGISLTRWFVRYLKCYDKCHKEGVYIVRMGVVNLFKSPLSRLHEKSCATGLRLTSKILHSEELPYIGIMEDLFRKHLLCSYCQRILVLGCVPLRAMLTLPFSTSYSFAISSGETFGSSVQYRLVPSITLLPKSLADIPKPFTR